MGFPSYLKHLDAALVWGKNKKTYLFRYFLICKKFGYRMKSRYHLLLSRPLYLSQNYYWRYDDISNEMDPGYPKDISRWRGVPTNIDAAMTWTDGRLAFHLFSFF